MQNDDSGHGDEIVHDDDDDDDFALPSSHPSRQQKKYRGWQGEDMEMDHQRETSSSITAGTMDKNAVTAVDLNQFRNTEVGKGYQARHVVRQKTAAATTTTDLRTGGDVSAKKKMEEGIPDTTRKKKARLEANSSSRQKQDEKLDRDKLLKNAGLRTFRKEIESILSSP